MKHQSVNTGLYGLWPISPKYVDCKKKNEKIKKEQNHSFLITLFTFSNQIIQVYPSKYCKLVEEEHGLELLRELSQHSRPNVKIKQLAEMVIRNCETNKNVESMQLDG